MFKDSFKPKTNQQSTNCSIKKDLPVILNLQLVLNPSITLPMDLTKVLLFQEELYIQLELIIFNNSKYILKELMLVTPDTTMKVINRFIPLKKLLLTKEKKQEDFQKMLITDLWVSSSLTFSMKILVKLNTAKPVMFKQVFHNLDSCNLVLLNQDLCSQDLCSQDLCNQVNTNQAQLNQVNTTPITINRPLVKWIKHTFHRTIITKFHKLNKETTTILITLTLIFTNNNE